MKILQCHNYYQQPGGEDQVFHAEAALLSEKGHDVVQFTLHNDAIKEMPWHQIALKTMWNTNSNHAIEELIQKHQPDICHFHNTFPLISPSAYYVCDRNSVPVVQTLHNYRLICPNGLFFRDNHICEDCLGKWFPWPGVMHACYHHSPIQTGMVSVMTAFHRLMRSWSSKVDQFIALTGFARDKFIESGLPVGNISVSPNFLYDEITPQMHPGDFALFVGRLSSEKGLMTLIEAWKHLPSIPLRIIGDGPLMDELKLLIEKMPQNMIILEGRQPYAFVFERMRSARVLIFPSVCYETFGLTIIEAFAAGLPVIASDQPTTRDLVTDGETGLFFMAGNSQDLAEKVIRVWDDQEKIILMGKNAREIFDKKFTKNQKYDSLMGIYEKAIRERA